MPECRFVTVDVFTAERFSGNPLAVVFNAEDLSDLQMQAVAAEFGYSETTFVLPPQDTANTAQVRIFTPVTEVPFAGHPNVGTGFALGRMNEIFGKPVGDDLRFEEKAGLVAVRLERQAGEVVGARITAPGPLTIGAEVDTATIAECLSLGAGDIATGRHLPAFVSVGLKFIMVELRDLDALARAESNLQALKALCAAHADENCDCATFLYVRGGDNGIRARMFAPLDNVTEDPATGSASAALGSYLAHIDALSGRTTFTIDQGVEMGRPSRIVVDVESDAGRLRAVSVAGPCVEVMRGMLRV
ncbi:PhzF family phenazine biosynthesis protein [Rhizobium halophytocola]|uniref:Trans-2,3-dihydro-3-hydroxyanthranilate isomerase n=1 Tax=Rhizobium halophytocola TaxID=735519 RepID=A0ABS4DT58_9HYPH|nr:PhzF family phenazine biosynthesis protein [Rhizobium halophytocola]MBP1848881.1 trans-2,3-dihydro-3-hydroxyanthranilate isomerase [Rhizobium halophytocola]